MVPRFSHTPAASSDAQLSTRWLVFYALLGAVALLPVLMFDHPGLTDHSNALARLHVLTSSPDAAVRAVYQPAWGLIPNLAVDALGVFLHPWLAPETTLKLVLAVSLSIVLIAVPLLQIALHGHCNGLLLLVPLVLINLVVSMGYLNYLAGVSVALIGVLLWIRLDDAPTWMRGVVCNAVGSLLFFCHIAALGLFGLVVSTLELFRVRSAGGWNSRVLIGWLVRMAAYFAVPAVLVVLSQGPDEFPALSWSDKARSLVAPTYVHHRIAFALATAVFATSAYVLLRSRSIVLCSAMVPALAALAFAIVVMPSQIGFAIDVDARLVVGLVFLLLACARPVRWSPRHTRILAAGVLIAVSTRSVLLIDQWNERAAQIASIRAGLVHVQAGERILVAQPNEQTLRSCSTAVVGARNLIWHLASFAVMDRAAFVPLLFTGQGVQPIRARAGYAAIDTGPSSPVPIRLLETSARGEHADAVRAAFQKHGIPEYFIDWPNQFDHLLVMHGGCSAELSLDVPLDLLAEGEIFSLYRIQPVRTADRAPRA